jgi:hypothetical protein
MLLSTTYQSVRPSPKLWTYARQSLQNLERLWGCELELRLAFFAEKRGVRATVTGRDKWGHAIAMSVVGRGAFAAIDSLVLALEQQSHWIQRRVPARAMGLAQRGTVLS